MLTELTPVSLPKGRRPQNRATKKGRRPKNRNLSKIVALSLLAAPVLFSWLLSLVRFLSGSCLALGRVRFCLPVSVWFCSASLVSTSSSKSNGRRPENRALLAGIPRDADSVAGMVLGIPDYFTAVLYARDGEVLYAMAVFGLLVWLLFPCGSLSPLSYCLHRPSSHLGAPSTPEGNYPDVGHTSHNFIAR